MSRRKCDCPIPPGMNYCRPCSDRRYLERVPAEVIRDRRRVANREWRRRGGGKKLSRSLAVVVAPKLDPRVELYRAEKMRRLARLSAVLDECRSIYLRVAVVVVAVLVASCVGTTEPKPLPLCKRVPIIGAQGDTVGWYTPVSGIGAVANGRVLADIAASDLVTLSALYYSEDPGVGVIDISTPYPGR